MKLFSIATVSAFMLTGAIHAAETAAVTPDNKPLDASSDDMNRVGSPAEASGKITSIHNATLVGVSDPHIIVKLTSDQGDIDIVDLGSAASLKQNGIDPKEGQQLWVEGKVGRINDKPLVFAEHVSESKLIAVTRTSPLREETTKHASARGDAPASDSKTSKTQTVDAGMLIRTVEGKVVHTRKVKIEGEAEEHMMAKLQTEEGVAVVDLGLVSTLPKVDLAEGQTVAVTGYVGHMNENPILIADSVGNLSSIQRAAVSTTPSTK